jgi:DNA repair protein RecO (recombination protein O)
MFTHYRTQGIVLDKINRGEADQLFTVLTEDFGLLEVFGKAIRKISSKLRAGMEIFYLSEIEFIEGRAYKTLTDAISQKKYFASPAALGNLVLAWRIADLIKKLTPSQQEDRVIFLFLKRSFEELQTPLSRKQQVLFLLFFFWNFIAFLGYKPELSSCVKCGDSIREEGGGFSLQDGGVLCSSCFSDAGQRGKIRMRGDSVKIIRFFLSNPWIMVKKLKEEADLLPEIRRISLCYLSSLEWREREKI